MPWGPARLPGDRVLERLILRLMEIRWREVSTEPSCFSPARAPQQDLSQCHRYSLSRARGLSPVPLQPFIPPDGRGHRGFCALGTLPPSPRGCSRANPSRGPGTLPQTQFSPVSWSQPAGGTAAPSPGLHLWERDGGDGGSVPQCRTQREEGGGRGPPWVCYALAADAESGKPICL